MGLKWYHYSFDCPHVSIYMHVLKIETAKDGTREKLTLSGLGKTSVIMF